MNVKTLGQNLAAVAAVAGQQMNTSPFIAGRSVAAVITVSPDFNGTIKLQSSDDNTTFADVASVAGSNKESLTVEVELKEYMRANVTAFTAGTASIQLIG